MTDHAYVLNTADELEFRRLAVHTELWDPFTCSQLQYVGVDEGWRCLEIGGGIGSVASWLQQQVGERGRVVVTDIETRWLEALAAPNLEVRRHNVVTDPLESEAYDLVHARLVLLHLPERTAVLAKLVEALRPGGWLVVEDYDHLSMMVSYPHDAALASVARGFAAALESAGTDVHHGRKLPAALEAMGLVEVGADGRVFPQRAGELAEYVLPVIERVTDRIIASGIATVAQLQTAIEVLRAGDPSQWLLSPTLISARGRRRPAS
jgi:SAM-dependent methyltransferase